MNSQELPICFCGYPQNDHNFRHEYRQCTKVELVYEASIPCFTLNALDFPLKDEERCSVPECNKGSFMHKEPYIQHPFQPKKMEWREVNFQIPPTTLCGKCGAEMPKHRSSFENNTDSCDLQHFKFRILLRGGKSNDRITIFDSDGDEINKNKIIEYINE